MKSTENVAALSKCVIPFRQCYRLRPTGGVQSCILLHRRKVTPLPATRTALFCFRTDGSWQSIKCKHVLTGSERCVSERISALCISHSPDSALTPALLSDDFNDNTRNQRFSNFFSVYEPLK
jgi:hypothetical protein